MKLVPVDYREPENRAAVRCQTCHVAVGSLVWNGQQFTCRDRIVCDRNRQLFKIQRGSLL